MPGLADFDVPIAKRHAQEELAAAAQGKSKPFSKLFMPELTDEEVGQFALALTFNEFGWFLLALVAHMRAMASYGYKNLNEAMKADTDFVDKRLGDYLAAIARPNVLEWAGLWKTLTEFDGTQSKAVAKTVELSLESMIADMLKVFSDAMPAMSEARKKIAILRSRLGQDVPEHVPGTMVRLADSLEKLENTLINELATCPSKVR